MNIITHSKKAYLHFCEMRRRATKFRVGTIYNVLRFSIVALFLAFVILFGKMMVFTAEEDIDIVIFSYTFAPVVLTIPLSWYLLKLESWVNEQLLLSVPEKDWGAVTCAYFRSFQVDRLERLKLIEHSEGRVRDAATQMGLVVRSFGVERHVGTIAAEIEHERWLEVVKGVAEEARVIVITPIATHSTLLEIRTILPHNLEKTFFLMPSVPYEFGVRDLIGKVVKWVAYWISFVILFVVVRRDPTIDFVYRIRGGHPMAQLWGWSSTKLKQFNIEIPPYRSEGCVFKLKLDDFDTYTVADEWAFEDLERVMPHVEEPKSRKIT